LCSLFLSEKLILIGTRRLGRELSLLKFLQTKNLCDRLDQQSKDELLFLKNFVEKVDSLSVGEFPAEIEWITFKNKLPTFWQKDEWKEVNEESKVVLKSLIKKTSEYRSSLFEKFSDYGLSLTAQSDLIRVHLLKFLALLPSLDHDKSGLEVKRNLVESLRRLNEDINSMKKKGAANVNLPLFLVLTFKFFSPLVSLIPAAVLAYTVRFLVKKMAKRFIAGESIATSDKTLLDLKKTSRDATLDQLGELVVSAREADEYFEKVLVLIHGLKKHIPKGEKNLAGIFRAHVSIKVSALCHDFKPQAFEATYQMVAPRLRRILQEAHREQVFINIDAEHYHYRDLVFNIYSKVLLETPELSDYEQTGIVVQAYLRDGAKHLFDVIDLAKKRKLRMPIRLVKGAYWDAETVEGAAHQFSPPQFLNKEESDLHFRQLAYLTLKHGDSLQLAIASHNLLDHSFVEALRTKLFSKAPVIEHQCLHMTYEALSHGLAKMNWPTRNYMPIGNLLVGMAYLVRRIMENSSQVGVLSIMRSHQKSANLIGPVEVLENKKQLKRVAQDSFISELKSEFTPVRPLRLFLDDERSEFFAAIELLKNHIDSHQQEWANSLKSKVYSSSRPELVVGVYEENNLSDVVSRIESQEEALKTHWWSGDVLARVSVMLKAADLMLLRRSQLSALIMYEAGKTMTEALADVDEAIDFISFYSRQEIEIQVRGGDFSNRGVIGVIAPWNFPLAIPCGMAVAPLVAGNSVILKPAEQTPLIAVEFYRLMLDAGVPSEVFSLIQGDGEIVGAPMVTHHRVAGVVFTGSKSVGQWIYKNAADKLIPHYESHRLMQKKIITEMGGKNAVIVTNNCELDETVSGILYGAFGHAGQKCSAASRVIVHHEVKEALVNRLIQAIRDIKVGEALDPSTSINPLIGSADQERVRRIVEEAKNEVIKVKGKIHIDRSFEKLPGYCVGPTLLELPLHQALNKESWAQREIFGPVIHIVSYHSLIEAVEVFNSTEYALTGGIYSQSQDDIDFLLKFLRAGNLYVNRPNTGARVAIEPFGGFKMSGTGPKAGGVGYVEEFHFYSGEEKSPQDEIHFSEDSGLTPLVPRPSVISLEGRLERFDKFTKNFFREYEKFMGVLSENEKSLMSKYSAWLKENLATYLSGKHPNFIIPGQLSYMDKSLIKEAGLFVMMNKRPSFKCLKYLFSNVALGNGVTVVCLTEESYQTWYDILKMIHDSGFTKVNFDLTKVSERSLVSYLTQPQFSFMYLDSWENHSKTIYKDLFQGPALSHHMKLILSENDGIDMTDFEGILDLFIWMRAMAINTMRHGAPLELGS
jgi:RHH-type proline utilization regulon transcriptional repressor/proline dehydrogenase/delta 1-pyrroline-5-carboxylate dehydrogenase